MYIHNLDPTIVALGKVQITWYGLVYSLGFLLTLFFLLHVSRNNRIKGFREDDAYDLVFYLMIGSIITARIFYIIFYNLGFYLSNPLQVFAFWNGGMSFHGGLVGAILAVYYFSKRRNISFLKIADVIVIPTALMLGFGRIANFINAELTGIPTDISWCVDFGDNICRHPSQLYESMKNFFTFGVLAALWVRKEALNLKDGTLFFVFMIMYGFLRFFITFYRVAEDYIFGIGTGQWLSLIMGLVGVYLLIKTYKKK